MWRVSSRSGGATLRTAIHLLLTYLLSYCRLPCRQVCVEPPPSVLDMTLPACAAERRRPQHCARTYRPTSLGFDFEDWVNYDPAV